jgi:sugar/nucleoside kinase (ribokinase family)
MHDVLVVGELNADLILNRLQSPPTMGKEVIASEMDLVMGSSSAIFACNLSSMGANVAFAGLLGKDILAELVMNTLKGQKVDTSNIIQSDDWVTGISVALVEGNDRIMVTHPGGMEKLTQEQITDEMLLSVKHLHVSSVFLQPALKKGIVNLFARAKKLGLTTSMDPQFDPSEKWDIDLHTLLPYVDIFLPNVSELEGFTGEKEPMKALRGLKDFSNIVVLKDGEHGAFLLSEGKLIHQPAYLNKDVVDIIGAGDSFDAGFIKSHLAGKDASECLNHAMMMGAVNTTGAGGTGAFEKGMEAVRKVLKEKWNIEID